MLGRKRHLLVDCLALVLITAFDARDLARARTRLKGERVPSLWLLWADGACGGLVACAARW